MALAVPTEPDGESPETQPAAAHNKRSQRHPPPAMVERERLGKGELGLVRERDREADRKRSVLTL